MKEDLEVAGEILQTALLSEDLVPPLLRRMFWGLMVVEKELSFCSEFEISEKIKHIEKAEGYNNKVASPSMTVGEQVHMELERYMIKGRTALLKLRQKPVSEASRLKQLTRNAIAGINTKLDEMRDKDPDRFNGNEKRAREWQNHLGQGLSSSSV